MGILGFGIGVAVAATLYVAVRAAAGGNASLWDRLVGVSVFLFPTHIFLLPLEKGDNLTTISLYFFLAFVANGLIYAAVAELAWGFYRIARTMFS
ncbi:MAG: hypothetical protein JOZ48_10850 [Acidobacteriaceae bacterium]|nr:hypothetical protein [Acidobacteriaceae bacterium]